MTASIDTVSKPAQKTQTEIKKGMHTAMETLNGFADDMSADVKKGAAEAQKMAGEYSKAAFDLAKKYPVYATLAAVGVGFAIGSLWMRKKD